MGLIKYENGCPYLQNESGTTWKPFFNGKLYGLGHFSKDSIEFGEPYEAFLEEESVGKQYRVSSYKILEDQPNSAKILFYGSDAKLGIEICASLQNGSNAVVFEYAIDPVHPIYHRLFVRLPLSSDKMDFIKYPYEDTLYPGTKRWCVETDISRFPFIFAKQNSENSAGFIGAGYSLHEPYDQCRMEIDPQSKPQAPISIYLPFKGMARAQDLQCISPLELIHRNLKKEWEESVRHFTLIVSLADSQYDCVKTYIDRCGFEKEADISYTVDNSVQQLFDMYHDMPDYVPQKGYPQLCRTDTGRYDTTIPHGWYSKSIAPGPAMLLSYELYNYWLSDPKEKWARERAFEMANFLVECQNENGVFGMYNLDTGEFRKSSLEDQQSKALHGFFFNTDDMSIGAYYLYLLHDLVKEKEGIVKLEWENAAKKLICFIIDHTSPLGEIGRNYSIDGNYDVLCPAVSSALMVLDYAANRNGDEEAELCRNRIEDWVYETRIKCNDIADGCMDGGAWVGDGKPPKNNDAVGLMGFINYCVHRYRETKNNTYITKARDAFAYQLLVSVPIQIPGYAKRTTGLVREQDFYSAYDLPFRINDYIDCLPYLSHVTGDPFFMQYMRIMLQTEMDYQEKQFPYKSFHIGLESEYDARTPKNKIAESVNIFILRFAPTFIKSVTGNCCYQYVSNGKWGYGLDYYLPFSPDSNNSPYVSCSDNIIRNITWNSENNLLHVWAYSRKMSEAYIEVSYNSTLFDKPKKVEIDGKNSSLKWNSDDGKIVIHAVNPDAPSKMINIQF